MKSELRLALIVCVSGAAFASIDPTATAQQVSRPKANVVAEGCLVTLIEERSVPAKEAGTLEKVNVHEGDEVRAGRPIAKLNAGREAIAAGEKVAPLAIIERDIAADQREAVAAARDRALADAKNRVSIEYAESLRDVAQSQLKILQRTNQLNPGSISNIELVKAEQEVRSADLRVKQAEHDFAQLSLTGIEKEAELRVAERSLEYREIRSPIDGIVVEVHAHEGEWVRPGDPVFRVVNLSRLRVQASFDIAKCSPSEVSGRDVSVDVVMTGGKVQTFTGRVAFVNPEIKSGGRFSVWAEVENQKDARGNYQLLPGMKADMTIVMNETPSAK